MFLPAACLAALVVASGAGCGQSSASRFSLNLEGRDPDLFRQTGAEKDDEDRAEKDRAREGLNQIATALDAMFGTPDEPFVFEESGLDIRKVRLAAGPARGHSGDGRRGLYRQHCVHCHGITGDGAGPTAAFLYPYPRDYRRGIFKFQSVERGRRPTVGDLRRTLVDGIPDTAMPSFALLPDDEIDALVEYVRYLAIRGETEILMMETMLAGDELVMERGALVETFLGGAGGVAEAWKDAENFVISPGAPPPPEEERLASIARGKELFMGTKAQCVSCHGETALGDGSKDALFDDWSKDRKPEEASWYTLPATEVKPRNLRMGVYRGGRRPIDLYRRVHAGINGTPMPGNGGAGGAQGALEPSQMWDIVNYVLSLPYESQAPSHAGSHVTTASRARN